MITNEKNIKKTNYDEEVDDLVVKNERKVFMTSFATLVATVVKVSNNDSWSPSLEPLSLVSRLGLRYASNPLHL